MINKFLSIEKFMLLKHLSIISEQDTVLGSGVKEGKGRKGDKEK